MADTTYKGSYEKRPIWQWILIYIVIGGAVYALIYFLFFANNTYSTAGTDSVNQQQNTTMPGY